MSDASSYRESKEVTYPTPKAFEKGKVAEAKNGWSVERTVHIEIRRPLWKKLLMGLMWHKRFPTKPKIIATYVKNAKT